MTFMDACKTQLFVNDWFGDICVLMHINMTFNANIYGWFHDYINKSTSYLSFHDMITMILKKVRQI